MTSKTHGDFDSHASAHLVHHTRTHGIPDLRFEYSYLGSVQRYITIRRSTDGGESRGTTVGKSTYEELGGAEDVEQERSLITTAHAPSEIIAVDWGGVAWITARDQVISPLLQGILW